MKGETKLYWTREWEREGMDGVVLHRVLYPNVHENGFFFLKKKKLHTYLLCYNRNMALCCRSCLAYILWPLTTLVIMGLICNFLQSTERIMMDRKEVSMTVSLHLNLGSKVESLG